MEKCLNSVNTESDVSCYFKSVISNFISDFCALADHVSKPIFDFKTGFYCDFCQMNFCALRLCFSVTFCFYIYKASSQVEVDFLLGAHNISCTYHCQPPSTPGQAMGRDL